MMSSATSAGDTAMESDLLACLPRLRRYAQYLTRDDDRAGDLVQDTVVKALTAAPQFQAGTSLMSWTTRILRNQFYDDLRRRRNEMRWLADKPDVEGSTKPGQEISLDLFDFRRAFWQLDEDHRKALILVGAAGLSHSEAAALCDCRVGTVKSRVHRARRELRRILQEGPLCVAQLSTSDLADYVGGVFDGIGDLRQQRSRGQELPHDGCQPHSRGHN